MGVPVASELHQSRAVFGLPGFGGTATLSSPSVHAARVLSCTDSTHAAPTLARWDVLLVGVSSDRRGSDFRREGNNVEEIRHSALRLSLARQFV